MADDKEVTIDADVEKTPRSPASPPPPDRGDEAKDTTLHAAPFPPAREALFLAVLCSTQLLMQASFGGVLLPVHLIGASLGVSAPADLSWFLAAYSAGRLGDRYGHRRLLVAGWLWFALWSAVAACAVWARSPVMFSVCRALQGIGPAVLLPNSLAILGRTYPPGRRKELVFAAYGATAPIGAVLGALVASALAQYAWWPAALWMNVGACAGLAALGLAVVPADELGDDRPELDVLGALLGVGGLVLVNVAWNEAPIVGWQQPYIIVILIVGLLVLGGFVWHERRVRTPLLPPGIIDATAFRVLVCVGLGWASFGVWVYYTMQLLEVLRGVSAMLAAVQFVPVIVTGASAAITTGYLLSRVHPSWLMVASMTAFTAGSLLSATAPVQQVYWANIFVGMLVTPWG